MECTSSLKQGLVDPSTSSNNSYCGTSTTSDGLLGSRGQPDSCLALIRRVSDNGCVVARCPCECTAITDLLLDVADNGTFWALSDGEDVADGEGGFFAAVDEGTGVETFGGNESFFAELVAVGITEDNTGEGCTTGEELRM